MAVGNKAILVIGDVMLDRYVFGRIGKVSPEASCPVFQRSGSVRYQLGGASNVASQISNAGYKTYIVGNISKDSEGKTLKELLLSHGVDCTLLGDSSLLTTTKERYISNANQQVFRIDYEEKTHIDESLGNKVLQYIKDCAAEISCIVLSDYNKGVVSHEFCQKIIREAAKYNIPTIVDIKTDDIGKYQGATVIKGNLKEILRIAGTLDDENQINIETLLTDIMPNLIQKLNTKHLVTTCGSMGIVACDSEGRLIRQAGIEHPIFDVTGAGDVVTAYLCMGLCQGLGFNDIIRYCNIAASQSVSFLGNALIDSHNVYSDTKLCTLDVIRRNTQGKKVVFSNGCFDVLHAGHIDLLAKAKQLGDVLIVGLNSDSSISRLKGESRPVNPLDYRVKVLSALSMVDYIVSFDEETPINLIKALSPEVLVKGGDYTPDTIVGSEYVKSYGGTVKVIPISYNISTSDILRNGKC